jgi:hypothetical protein
VAALGYLSSGHLVHEAKSHFHLVNRIRCGSVSPPSIHPHGILPQCSVITGLETDIYNKYVKMFGCKVDISVKNGTGIFRIDDSR